MPHECRLNQIVLLTRSLLGAGVGMPYDWKSLDGYDRDHATAANDEDVELTIHQAVGFAVLSSAVLVVRAETLAHPSSANW